MVRPIHASPACKPIQASGLEQPRSSSPASTMRNVLKTDDKSPNTSGSCLANTNPAKPIATAASHSAGLLMPLHRVGNPLARTILVECAWSSLRYNPWAKHVYDRICGKQKTRKKKAAMAAFTGRHPAKPTSSIGAVVRSMCNALLVQIVLRFRCLGYRCIFNVSHFLLGATKNVGSRVCEKSIRRRFTVPT